MVLQPDLAVPLLLGVDFYLDDGGCRLLGSAVAASSAALSVALALPLLSLLFLRFGVLELKLRGGLLDPPSLMGGDVAPPQGVVRAADVRQHGKSYLRRRREGEVQRVGVAKEDDREDREDGIEDSSARRNEDEWYQRKSNTKAWFSGISQAPQGRTAVDTNAMSIETPNPGQAISHWHIPARISCRSC